MAKKNPQDDTKFDVRTLPHQFRRGHLDPKDYASHLDALPDEAEEAVESNVRFTAPFADRQHSEGGKG